MFLQGSRPTIYSVANKSGDKSQFKNRAIIYMTRYSWEIVRLSGQRWHSLRYCLCQTQPSANALSCAL